MSEIEIYNEYMKNVKEQGATKDEWLVRLLSCIAHSLAIIADNTNKAESEGKLNETDN